MVEKISSFYKLLGAETPNIITTEVKETFESVNKALSDVSLIAMKQLLPGKHIFLMTDGSFRCAGYALMIEDNPDQKIQSKRKIYAPGVFGPELLLPVQLELSIYSKEFLGTYMACSEFSDSLWEKAKPAIIQLS